MKKRNTNYTILPYKKPPYKIDKKYYIINLINCAYITVYKETYLGYAFNWGSYYPTMLFGGTRTRPRVYPNYTNWEFNPEHSGMTVASSVEELLSIVIAHTKCYPKIKISFE